jgi:hypothetical protein
VGFGDEVTGRIGPEPGERPPGPSDATGRRPGRASQPAARRAVSGTDGMKVRAMSGDPAAAYATTPPVLCAHASKDGRGAHVPAPGEKCPPQAASEAEAGR